MSKEILPYTLGLIQGVAVTTTVLQRQFGYSHDQLTRTLAKSFPWEQLIALVIQRLFGFLSGGFLILDDTVINKMYAKKMQGAGYVYSSLLEKTVFGYNLVSLCWSNGKITLPLAWKWYSKRKDAKSRIDLAIELLVQAKNRWKMTPEFVVFDSYYAAMKLLDKLHSYGRTFVTQLRSNRVVNSVPLREELTKDGESMLGLVSDKVQGMIVRHGGKYFCTNNIHLSLTEMLFLYGFRWSIEEVFRFLKQELRLERCQARSKQAQKNHLGCCLLLYLFIYKEKLAHSNLSMYALRQQWMLDKRLGRRMLTHYFAPSA